MTTTPGPVLHHDPRWTRAGDWPGPPAAGAGDRAVLALLGIPTWRTSLSPTGAGATPGAIRAALRRYSTWADGVDLADRLIVDHGDVEEPDGPDGEQRARAAVARAAGSAELLVVLGGDNAATVPAALGTWGPALDSAGLVTLDAHHDLRDGTSNGSPVRRLLAAGLAGSRTVQVGIADFANSAAYERRAREYGITVIPRSVLARRPVEDVVRDALDIAGAGGGPVHVDLDVDVVDRSAAPACPASLPGGISADELRRAARAAAADPRVRSMDITEVDASADVPDGRTVRLAALLVLEAARGVLDRPGPGA